MFFFTSRILKANHRGYIMIKLTNPTKGIIQFDNNVIAAGKSLSISDEEFNRRRALIDSLGLTNEVAASILPIQPAPPKKEVKAPEPKAD